ncbi:hypothetical protein BH11PSE13_BH11PSE13_09430 [soil metagenome]
MNESRIKTLLTVLPALSAGLYLLGATYLQGYLNTFGIDESMFPTPIDRLVFSGFVAFIAFVLVPSFYGFLAMLALSAMVLITAALSSVRRVKHWQTLIAIRLERMRSDNSPSPSPKALVDKSETIYLYAIGVFAITMLLLLSMVLSTRTGKEQARYEIGEFERGEGNSVLLLTDTISTPKKAKQLICGANYFAFWTGNETLIVRHEQVRQIAVHPDASKLLGTNKPVKTP